MKVYDTKQEAEEALEQFRKERRELTEKFGVSFSYDDDCSYTWIKVKYKKGDLVKTLTEQD